MFIYGRAKKPDEKKVESKLRQDQVRLIAVREQNVS